MARQIHIDRYECDMSRSTISRCSRAAAFGGFCYSIFLIICLIEITQAIDMLTPPGAITDGMTLVSARNVFEFGFFSPGSSRNRYLGIWYFQMSPQTIVWVANGNNPLNDSSGVVSIAKDGNFILQDQTERIVWSTGAENISSNGTFLQLLDSGNLVLRNDNGGNAGDYIWQSFDHFSNTWLTGMELGKDPSSGLFRRMTSWTSADDPAPGQYSCSVNPRGPPLEFVLWEEDSLQYRSGPWNGVGFSGLNFEPNNVFDLKLVVNAEETYYEYVPETKLVTTRSVLNYSGIMQRYVWNATSLKWLLVGNLPNDPCDNYGHCGANSICTISDPTICSCLTGFIPKSQQGWEIHDWTGGCVRKHPLNCSKGEGFLELKGVKVPDHWLIWINTYTGMSLKECQAECLKNCSCTAYANSNVSGQGSGCLIWHGDLIDVRQLVRPSAQNLYIRVAASDLGPKKRNKVILVVLTSSLSLTVMFSVCCIILLKRAHIQAGKVKLQRWSKDMEDLELPTFEIMSVAKATNNFSESNKLGEGGFGPVFKGQIPTGQEIAVKRLSVDSNQGLIEFKNEVKLISKLQHRNLVKLLGCCIQGEERMLIYEYMHNKSLDYYIYDSTRRHSLTWTRLLDIIIGIARGLLYLHRDSRLRIVHRDLKASNILLDREMNPKISDFGIARTFGGDQSCERTGRVVGTYGYMSPEYVVNGLYSMKSDVFSLGVLILEIISGRKNRGFCHPDHNLNLLGHAWKLWHDGNASQLIDELMEESFPMSEVEKCIQVGLLCVQRRPEDRPTMSDVLLMLDGESTILPQPKTPGFYMERCGDERLDLLGEECPTTNDVTITVVEGR